MESVLDATELVDQLVGAVAGLQAHDLSRLTAKESLALVRAVEVAQRRLEHAATRLADHLDSTGAYGVDGHRSAKAALVHVARLPGAEAHARVQTARALRSLPGVEAVFAAGEAPVASIRAIGRVAANPRVQGFLDDVVDTVFAEQARTSRHDDLVAFVREWERVADSDGPGVDPARTFQRRTASHVQNEADGSWTLTAHHASLEGAVVDSIFRRFEHGEWLADHEAALAEHGPGYRPEQMPRTPAQRRADALLAVFRAAASAPADGQPPEPVVNVVIDEQTLATELARTAGEDVTDDPARVLSGERICRTTTGAALHPADAVAALLVGHVRRVVLDAHGTVIDLGRRRRCFTGSSRHAALLQDAIRNRSGTRCFWASCLSPPGQVDHHHEWHRHGPTTPGNSQPACGHHNRLKETGYRNALAPDGTITYLRPDGTPITPPA